MLELGAVIALIAALCAAVGHVRRNRHPGSKPIEAYLIFLVSFAIVGSVFFGLAVWSISSASLPWISDVLAAFIVFAASFGPALIASTWIIRRPPSVAPRIE